jgi:hypothetical protein
MAPSRISFSHTLMFPPFCFLETYHMIDRCDPTIATWSSLGGEWGFIVMCFRGGVRSMLILTPSKKLSWFASLEYYIDNFVVKNVEKFASVSHIHGKIQSTLICSHVLSCYPAHFLLYRKSFHCILNIPTFPALLDRWVSFLQPRLIYPWEMAPLLDICTSRMF